MFGIESACGGRASRRFQLTGAKASPANIRISIVDASALTDDFLDIRPADAEIVEFTIGQAGQFTDGFTKTAPSMELRRESFDHSTVPFY
jgi:hypothetical protein